jgi:site-specific DNA recombinase
MPNIYLIPAVGYVRCSTDSQDDSIRQQKVEISSWAEKNNIKIIRWYEDEGFSGTTFESRPAFTKLLNDVENGADFRIVLVYDESRWGRARNPRMNGYWKTHFERFGVKVRIINSQSNNGNDVGSYVVEAVESAESSEFIKKLSRATLRGEKANALNGYSNGGSAPYGYKRVALNKVTGKKVRELTPGLRAYNDEKVIYELGDPAEVSIVKKIFNLKSQGLGYKRIASILNEEGVPCPKRGRWKNKDQKWSIGTIYTIVTNPTYTGSRIFNRHPQSHLSGTDKESWLNQPNEWVIKKNAHPAIISEELFNRVNKSRKDYQRQNRRYYESPYLLSGLLKCQHCGYNFQGQTRKLTSKETGKDYEKKYYEDSGYMNKGNAVCNSYLLRKEAIEEFIIKKIKELITPKSFIDRVVKSVENKLQDKNNIELQLKEISSQMEKKGKAAANLLELLRNGITLKEVQDDLLRINKENDHLQKMYNDLKEKTIDKNDMTGIIKTTKYLINNFETTFTKSPVHIQKNLIRQFVSEIIVNQDEHKVICFFRKVPWMENEIIKEYDFGTNELSVKSDWTIKASRRTSDGYKRRNSSKKQRIKILQNKKQII